MRNGKQPRKRQREEEFLNRFAVPGSKPVTVLIPGFDNGPRPELTFVLKALDGKHEEMVARHLGWFLADDMKKWRMPLEAWIRHDPEHIYRAVNSFTETLRSMADMWIDSGKNPLDRNVDTPTDRNVEDVQPGYESSLFVWIDLLVFDRCPRYTKMRRDGSIGSREIFPHLDRNEEMLSEPVVALDNFGQMWAAWHFAGLLDSPYSRQIARCDHCKGYFAYQKTRLRTVKNGVFCPKCKSKGSLKRTERSRAKRLDTAAKAWMEWESKTRRIEQSDWVWRKVNESHGTAFGRRWVSQNSTEILKRVEAQRNAKG